MFARVQERIDRPEPYHGPWRNQMRKQGHSDIQVLFLVPGFPSIGSAVVREASLVPAHSGYDRPRRTRAAQIRHRALRISRT